MSGFSGQPSPSSQAVFAGAERGGLPGIGQVLIRTIFRLFEGKPLIAGGVPAGIAAAVGKRKRRLGDMAVNTYVIFSKGLGKVRSP